MPKVIDKKLAAQHKKTTKSTEGQWKKAKKAALKKGPIGEHDYVSGVFKKMLSENGSAPSFLQFLLIENELDSLDFDVERLGGMSPARPSAMDTGELDGLDPKDDPYGVYDEVSDDAGIEPGQDVDVDLENDERFLALPRSERFRIKKLANELTGYELDDELTQAYEKSTGGASYFTRDSAEDPEVAEPVVARDPNAPRQRAKSGATHAYKIRRGI